ncbi:MAG: tetratricopeptide repeat protein [Pyrinomonadaceae bacterium]
MLPNTSLHHGKPASETSLMIGQTISHYRILEKLGEGGMGVVYVGEDTHLGRRVAIKIPHLSAAESTNFNPRFLREARAASTLTHPHIATVYDYGETLDGQPFIVMELVNGRNLDELLTDDALSMTRAVEIVIQVAEALAEAHAHGIIHRDIKPSNIAINERGQVKVLDFGLAKQLADESSSSAGPADPHARTVLASHTRSGAVVGTPLYLSPEQATGAQVDARSDIFALGALLYECVAGRSAFSGANFLEIGAQVIYADPQPPSAFNPRVPAELDRIALKALAKRPDSRYQSAAELIEHLRSIGPALAKTGGIGTHRLTAPTGAFSLRSLTSFYDSLRRPRLSPGAIVAVLALAALCVFWGIEKLWSARRAAPSPEAVSWYEKGLTAFREGAIIQARGSLERAVQADDNFVMAHARLAEAAMELDDYDKAREEMLRAESLERAQKIYLTPLDELYLEAANATVTRDTGRAVNRYREIVEQTPDQATAYLDLGRAYERDEKLDKAVESYVEATKKSDQYAFVYVRLGSIYARQQKQEEAAGAFDQADKIYRALGNSEGRAEVFYQRGLFANRNGRLVEARANLEQAIKFAEINENEMQQVNARLQMSSVAYNEGETTAAERMANEAVSFAEAKGMESIAARGLVDLGNVFLLRSSFDDAEKYYQRALQLAVRSKARRGEARALFSLGSLRIRQGKLDEGQAYLERALPFYKGGGYRGETARAFHLLGKIKQQRGSYDEALQAFNQQLKGAKQAGDVAQEALSHTELGGTLSMKEHYPEALVHFEKCVEQSEKAGNKIYLAHCLTNQGDVLWQLGRYQEADQALAKALTIADQPGVSQKELVSKIHLITALAALSGRNFPKAKSASRATLALAVAHYQDAEMLAKCTLGLASAFAGEKALGSKQCGEAIKAGASVEDVAYSSLARLMFAEAQLEAGDARGARATAEPLLEPFARAGQHNSAWQSYLVVGLADLRAGDRDQARERLARADEFLKEFQTTLKPEAFEGYLSRPDIQLRRRQLNEALASVQ